MRHETGGRRHETYETRPRGRAGGPGGPGGMAHGNPYRFDVDLLRSRNLKLLCKLFDQLSVIPFELVDLLQYVFVCSSIQSQCIAVHCSAC